VTAGPRRRLRLGTLSLVVGIVAGLVVVGLAFGLVASSRKFRHATRELEEARRAVTFTGEVDRILREHRRIGNVWAATREPQVAATVSEIDSDLRGFLAGLEAQVWEPVGGVGSEPGPLAELYGSINAYLAEHEAALTRGLRVEELVRVVRPSFERALASSASMRGRSEARLRRATREAERVLRLESLLAIVSGFVLVAGVTVVTVGLRLLVLRPLLEIGDAMRRFRRGHSDARAGDERVREMADLAATFNEMAEAIARARRDQLTFLAAVAHDLRNPLHALKLGVHALTRETSPISPERWKLLERNIDRVTRMVGDLLDATRIEAGELELQLEEFDLCAAVRATIDLFAPTTSAHRITARTPDRPVLVRGDSLRIEQVISNLVSNAIKYSPAGGPVEVAVQRSDREAELSVSDRGLGIPADEIPDMFLPFRRRSATREPIQGVGLGLSIVARIVKAHGGQIAVESTPGIGSTFRVRLPLRQG
jgi:two-component system, OmpR family, sensor histidine kinase MtrB